MSSKSEAVRARGLFAEIRRENATIANRERELGSKLVLARNVLRLRVQRGMTQTQLARAAGIAQPRIAEIENARANPRLDTLERVARAFGAPVENLFKSKHAERKYGAAVHASVHLSTRGNAGKGWESSGALGEVVSLSEYFGPSAPGQRGLGNHYTPLFRDV